RGRVGAVPSAAAESIVTAAAGDIFTLVTGVAGSNIDGFTLNGAAHAIESTNGPLDGLQVINNDFRGSTAAAVFLNDPGVNITFNQNAFDGTSIVGGSDLFHLDTDNSNGFYLTNNWLQN